MIRFDLIAKTKDISSFSLIWCLLDILLLLLPSLSSSSSSSWSFFSLMTLITFQFHFIWQSEFVFNRITAKILFRIQAYGHFLSFFYRKKSNFFDSFSERFFFLHWLSFFSGCLFHSTSLLLLLLLFENDVNKHKHQDKVNFWTLKKRKKKKIKFSDDGNDNNYQIK